MLQQKDADSVVDTGRNDVLCLCQVLTGDFEADLGQKSASEARVGGLSGKESTWIKALGLVKAEQVYGREIWCN